MTSTTPTVRAVYDEHFEFVWRSLRRLGVREADTADAVQDVFIVVHRKLGEFEGRSKLTTWLFGIALRVARDRQKLAHVRHVVDDEVAVLGFADENADVGAEAERRQAAGLLEGMLDEMPLEQRAVFALFELEEQTGEGIAELLEIPLGTVYSRLRLARECFQRSIARLRARADGPGRPPLRAGAGVPGRAPPLPSSRPTSNRPKPLPPPRPSGFQRLIPEREDIGPQLRLRAGGAA